MTFYGQTIGFNRPEYLFLLALLPVIWLWSFRSLAGLVLAGELDLAHLPEDDEEAIAQLIKIKGIGRWSAEIYLLFAEGRHDVWPAGDLAVQIQIGKLLGLEGKPTEKQLRELGEKWRPHRGAAAVLAWHSYNSVGTAL